MDRRSVIRSLTAAAAAALLGLALTTCSNPIDIFGVVSTEVKAANNLFLLVGDFSPAKNAINIPPSSTVWIQFDRPLDTSTVNTATVVFDPAVTWTFTYAASTNTLTVRPSKLDGPAHYQVRLAAGLKGQDGSDLQSDYVWEFDTKEGPSGSVLINGDAAYTTNASATLTIDYNVKADRMRYSTDITRFDGTAPDEPWVTAAPTGAVTLPDPDGAKTVYIQFMDSSTGDTTDAVVPIGDSIVLDRAPPVLGSFTIENGAYTTAGTAVTLYNDVTDATSPMEMRFTNTGGVASAWEPYAPTKAWTLSAIGTRQVTAEYRDVAGNAPVSTNDAIIAGTVAMTSVSQNNHAITPEGSVAASWASLPADVGVNTYYLSRRTRYPQGAWTLTLSTTATGLTFAVPAGTIYDFAVQVGNSVVGGGTPPATAAYGAYKSGFTSDVAIVYNSGDRLDSQLADAIKTILTNRDGWMTTYGTHGTLPPWTVTLVPQVYISRTDSTLNRFYAYPTILTHGVTLASSYPGWVHNIVAGGTGLVAMGLGGANTLDVVNAYGAKWLLAGPLPVNLGFRNSQYVESRVYTYVFAKTLTNSAWISPLYFSTPVADGFKAPVDYILRRLDAGFFLSDPPGFVSYAWDPAVRYGAPIAQQGRFLQYGYYGIAGSTDDLDKMPYTPTKIAPQYLFPLFVNLVYRMGEVYYP